MGIKEEWRDIIGYENLYQCSNLGRIKSLGNGKSKNPKLSKERILNQSICKGYCLVGLCKEGKRKMYQVHRIVATTFLPNPENLPQVNHKDENPQNNMVSNLEFCDAKYNANYATRNEKLSIANKGKVLSQETKNKLSKAQSKPILQFNREGTKIIGKYNSATQASNELNINQDNITKCCRGKLKVVGGYRWMYLQDYVNRMEKLYQMVLKNVS